VLRSRTFEHPGIKFNAPLTPKCHKHARIRDHETNKLLNNQSVKPTFFKI